jgi:hypothetical protein
VLRPPVALVSLRLPGWCALCAAVAAPGIGFPGEAAGSGRELYCKLQAQRAAFPRLRRSHTCRCGRGLRGRAPSRGSGDRSPSAADAPRLPLLGFQRCPSVDISALRPVPAKVVLRRFPPSAREMPLSPAPSALAVLPGFDGLLRCAPRRVRAPGVPDQLALSQLPSAFFLQPTLGFMPFRRLPLCSRVSRSVLVPFGARSARIVSPRAALAGASPVMPYPSKLFPRQQPSRRHRRAIPSRRCRSLRWSSSRLRTADDDSAGGCRPQGLAPLPKSGSRMLSPAVLPQVLPWACSWRGRVEDASADAERTSRAVDRDRSRSPGRTRVHPAYRPRSDLDNGATSPRLIRRILWGSVLPGRMLATALRRAGRAGSAQAAWRRRAYVPASVLRSSLLRRNGPKSLSLSHESQVCAACPTLHRPLRTARVRVGDASRNDAASVRPATSFPGLSRGLLERRSW